MKSSLGSSTGGVSEAFPLQLRQILLTQEALRPDSFETPWEALSPELTHWDAPVLSGLPPWLATVPMGGPEPFSVGLSPTC